MKTQTVNTERWFFVNVHYACFGIGAEDSKIFFAPPIATWMIGKTLQEIKPWLLQKKAQVIELKQTPNEVPFPLKKTV